MENSLDIGDYMDIVTTYKCRFCSFTSNLPQGISNHVRQVHVSQQMIGQVSDTCKQESSTNQNADNKHSVSQVDHDHGLVYKDNSQSKVQVVSELTFVDMATEMATSQGIQASEGTITSLGGSSTADKILELSNGVDNGSETDEDMSDKGNSNQNNDEIIHIVTAHGSNPVQVEYSSTGTDVDSLQDGFMQDVVESFENPIISQEEVNNTAIATSDNVANNKDIEMVDTNVQVPIENQQIQTNSITKELFLCGQCSVGFGSIDDCKTHMLQEHNAPEDELTATPAGKVSVGTQYEGTKKLGRKKKQEKTIEIISDSESDQEEYFPRGSRTRRNIKPPKALKDDYYLGKRKKKERPKLPVEYKEKCPQIGCYAKFKTAESLQIHLQCHVDGEFIFRCVECNEEHAQWKNLRFHLWKKHKIDTDLIQCDQCEDYKTDTLSKLMVHKEIHSEDRPYTCDVCGKGFKQFSQMRNHQMIHTEHQSEDQRKWYNSKECEICKRRYANKKCLNKHIQAVHVKIKPFVCPYCGHSAARKAMMELHIRTHTGEKPFKCDVCPYTTGDHNSLRRHKMRHTGHKPYRCDFCGYSCIQAISLKMHMKNKHPSGANSGVYCCDICTFRTVNELNYKNHIEDHKNGLIIDSSAQDQVPPQHVIISTSLPEIRLQNVIQSQQAVSSTPHDIIEIETPGTKSVDVQNKQLQMQIQTLESGETQISEEDLTRLTSYEGLVPSDISAAQLVLSALNAISESSKNPDVEPPQILDGIQTSITSTSIKEGVTTHTITFHFPETPVQDPPIIGTVDTNISSINLEEVQQLPGSNTLVFSAESVGMDTVLVNNDQPTATIQDLAQVSCLLKNNVFTTNGTETMVIETVPQSQADIQN